ncbi:MAG TPA: amino acid ABC transporter substrate-binding protein [Streptosporangiaceae bacterium]|nr:amino acid ABC transporter substrate-binding protein [Streptosporangiaceae bacterium]
MSPLSVTAARIAVVVATAGVAACGIGSTGTPDTGNNAGLSGTPIRVGISVSLKGDFKDDGLACLRGYQLWASDVNSHGGLLGRPVKLVVLNDNSDPNTAARNYTTLITQDHVDLTLGPFSSLLTLPAARAARKHGYAMVEGSGTAPTVYAASLKNLFGVSAPVANQLVPFADWVAELPPGSRPRSAAYAMVADPFADPPVQTAQTILEKAGVTTVYSNASAPYTDTSPAALAADARQVAAQNPQIVVIGSVDLPTVTAFIDEFKKLRFNPRMLIATSGPDQGQAFLDAIGTSNADGIMVPNGWYGGFSDALSHVMVQEYIARYGGTSSDINADVAEAYSAGQVMAEAVQSAGLSQSKIIAFLHSGVLIDTVQGPASWDRYVAKQPSGQNTKALSFVFQWQPGANFVQVLSSAGTPSTTIIAQKEVWTSS